MIYNDTMPFNHNFTYSYLGGNASVTTQPIVGGNKYSFKYRGINLMGQGAWSTAATYILSTVPDQLAPAVTSLYNQTVTITWAPSPNIHCQTVTAYRVKIKAKNGTMIEDVAICQGSKAAVVSSLKCSAYMSLFTGDLGLAINDLIVVTVEALNVMGYSNPSNPNTIGILAKKLPQTAPSALARGA